MLGNYDGSVKFDTSIDTKPFEEGFNELKQIVAGTLNEIKAAAASAKTDISKMKDEYTSSLPEMDKASETTSANFSKLKKIAAGALAAITATAAAATVDIAKTGAEFTVVMSKVGAISGASAKDMQDLSEKAKEMGASTVFSASEAAEAFTYMAMAGWKTADMLDGVEGIMSLAAASGESLAATSDIVTDALTAFGLTAADAGHFADVMAAASSNANTNVSMMGETFKYVASMAGSLGYDIEDVSVAIGLMANSGIKGTMAGTALNSILTRLATNTSGAADAASELGVEFFDAEGNARDFGDVISELRKATADMTSEQKTQLAYTVAGTEASKGFLAVINASENDFEKLTLAIESADGAAKGMSDTMVDNLQGDLTLASSALEGLKLAAYNCIEEPFRSAAKSATAALNELTAQASDGKLKNSLQRLGSSAGKLLESLSELAAKVLPSVINLLSFFADNIGAITAALVAYKAATALTTAALAVYKLAVKAAAAEQSILNMVISANPMGILTTLIGVAAAAIVGFGSSMASAAKETEENSKKTKKLAEELRGLKDAYKEANEQLENTTGKGKEQAEQITVLAERIVKFDKALDDAGIAAEEAEKTKKALYNAVSDLKKIVPDFVIELDGETGRLITQREEVEKLAKSYSDLLVIKSKSEYLSEKYKNALEYRESVANSLDRDEEMKKLEEVQSLMVSNDGLKTSYGYFDKGFEFDGKKIYTAEEKAYMALRSSIVAEHKNKIDEYDQALAAADRELADIKAEMDAVALEYADMEINIEKESDTSANGTAKKAPTAARTESKAITDLYSEKSKALKHSLAMDEISEEDYYKKLEELRDSYLEKDGDEWNRATESIYEYRKKQAENAARTEAKTVTDLYSEKSKALNHSLAMDEISEEDYYKRLEELRDSYLEKDGDEWNRATESIYEYRKKHLEELVEFEKQAVENAYNDIASFADSSLGSVEAKIEALKDKLASFGTLMNEKDGVYSLANPKETLEALLDYDYYIGKVRDRMSEMNIDSDTAEGFLGVMAGMSVEEGTEFARLLSEQNDWQFGNYIGDWRKSQELADKISKDIYKNEHEKAADETKKYIDKRLAELGAEIPEEFKTAGQSAGEQFKTAFGEQISALIAETNLRLAEYTFGIGIGTVPMTVTAKGAGGTMNQTNNAYNYTINAGKRTTAAEIRSTLAAGETLMRLGGLT